MTNHATSHARRRLVLVSTLSLVCAAVLIVVVHAFAQRTVERQLADPPAACLVRTQAVEMRRVGALARYLRLSTDEARRVGYTEELAETLARMEQAHATLNAGDHERGVEPFVDPAMRATYDALDQRLATVVAAGRALVETYRGAPPPTAAQHGSVDAATQVILDEEESVVAAQTQLAELIEERASAELQQRGLLQSGLLLAALAALLCVGLFGLRPALVTISNRLTHLEQAARRHRLLVENVQDLILEIGDDGRVLFANPAMSALLEVGAEHLSGRTLPELAHRDDRSAVQGYLRATFGPRETAALTFRLLDAKGDAHWVETTARAYAGESLRAVVVGRDVADRKRADQEHALFQRQLEHRQRLESLGVLASGVAHDFNNILVGVLGNADLARSAVPADSPARPRLLDIETAARRAASLTNQLLAYSGKAALTKEVVDMNATIAAMGSLLEVSVPKKAHLEVLLGETAPEVIGDRNQLRQVLLNLVTNAGEALRDGEGSITVRTGEKVIDRGFLSESVLGDELREGTYVVLEVEDTGEGMRPQQVRRAFDPFFSTRFAGRGLGLAALLGIVKAHGGAVRVESALDEGTRVTVLLPSASATLFPKAPPEKAPPTGTVLVVDDEPAVRRLVGRMLKKIDCEVIEATDGQEALEVLRQHRDVIGAALLDYAMPRMDGVETYAALREIVPDLPVVVMSGFPVTDTRRRFHDADLVGVLHKPFEFEELVGTLRSALRERVEVA